MAVSFSFSLSSLILSPGIRIRTKSCPGLKVSDYSREDEGVEGFFCFFVFLIFLNGLIIIVIIALIYLIAYYVHVLIQALNTIVIHLNLTATL